MGNGTCRECGKAAPLSSTGRQLMYCSKYCANRRHVIAYRKRRGSRRNRQSEYFDRTCVTCGQAFRSSRATGKYCSDGCKGQHYRETRTTRCWLPSDHPVMLLIADLKAQEKVQREAERRESQRPKFEWRTARECPGCACWFTPLHTPNAVCCSNRCAKRMSRQRRRAREAGARGTFTWSEFMRIARKFNYCCAYCGVKPERLDPDHVVPLSRGGSNAPSNLLPSCNMCNSSKCAMTLPEWAEWLAVRGLPPRATTWTPGDLRYTHLTDALLATAA